MSKPIEVSLDIDSSKLTKKIDGIRSKAELLKKLVGEGKISIDDARNELGLDCVGIEDVVLVRVYSRGRGICEIL